MLAPRSERQCQCQRVGAIIMKLSPNDRQWHATFPPYEQRLLTKDNYTTWRNISELRLFFLQQKLVYVKRICAEVDVIANLIRLPLVSCAARHIMRSLSWIMTDKLSHYGKSFQKRRVESVSKKSVQCWICFKYFEVCEEVSMKRGVSSCPILWSESTPQERVPLREIELRWSSSAIRNSVRRRHLWAEDTENSETHYLAASMNSLRIIYIASSIHHPAHVDSLMILLFWLIYQTRYRLLILSSFVVLKNGARLKNGACHEKLWKKSVVKKLKLVKWHWVIDTVILEIPNRER